MLSNEWLQKLKVGDKVLVVGSGLNRSTRLGMVVKLTKNFIVVNSNGFDFKYRNISGWGTGDSHYSSSLKEATPEALIKFEELQYRQIFQNKLNHLSWADVPLDRIKQIRELVEPYVKRQEKKI
jgi:hypothetical protein